VLLDACDGAGAKPASPTVRPVAAAKPKSGGTLWIAAVRPAADLDPVTMNDPGSIVLVQQVAEYLVRVGPDYVPVPELAVGWAPNADASVWTFRIRQGVRFSDGTALSAADVVASLRRLLDPASGAGDRAGLRRVLSPDGVVKTGTYEVAFHLSRPFVDFPYLVASTSPNAVILPAAYQGDFAKNPVGTGPFLLRSYKDGAAASLVRNPGYWRSGQPYLDRVEFSFFSSASGTMVGIEGGMVDVACATPALESPVATETDVRLLPVRSTYYDQLFFRTDRAPFHDRRVRQAFGYAIDRDAVISRLFGRRARVGGDHVFAPGFPHSPALAPRPHDPAKARALLAEAGLSAGFTTTLSAENNGWAPDYAALVQSAARDIGVTIQLDLQPSSRFRAPGPDSPWLNAPLGIVGWADAATAEQYYGAAFLTGAPGNSAHWSDPAFDALATQFEGAVDQQTWSGLAQHLAVLQQDETPAVIAYWVDSAVVARNTVQGLSPSGSQSIDLTAAWLA
jgi:peptide/nickel transport system substrate-binding protein